MIGKTISHYRIVEKLGEGGMGVVYKAEDTKLHRTVALKFIRPDAVENRELNARFLTEAEAAAALTHPNICVVYEIDEADKQSFIAMEYVDGERLTDKVKERPLPLEEALGIAAQLAEGLQAAHEKGIVHRDIKPANVMVDESGRLKIMDFGLAYLNAATRITKTGTVLGTPAYMSPEQVRGEKMDHRTDIWSFGVVLYEMVTGQLPFRGEAREAISHSILNAEPEPLTAMRSGLPVGLDRLVEKALAKEAGERYQHMDEMLVDLRLLSKGQPETACPPAPRREVAVTGRRALKYASPLAFVLVLTALWTYVTQIRTPGPAREVSIAVLPLENLSGDPEQEYFSDGMTEALISDLGTIRALKVVSRTSVMQFKGAKRPLREIAQALNVTHVVEGSVVRAGDQVRITATLIDARSDQQLWSGSYQRALVDVLALQSEVARATVEEIQVALTPQELDRLDRTVSVAPKAYEAYLRGLFHWNIHSAEAVKTAVRYLRHSIEIDPGYAQAHALLSDSLLTLANQGEAALEDACPAARAAARKAVELDAELGEAYLALARVNSNCDWELEGYLKECRRAIELKPGYAEARCQMAYALALRWVRFEEAIAAQRRARDLDPLSMRTNYILGNMLFWARRYDEAIEQFEKTYEMVQFPRPLVGLGWAYLEKGMPKEAVAELERAIALGGDSYWLGYGHLARAYALTGRRTEAFERLNDLEKQSVEDKALASHMPVFHAMVHAAFGNNDLAFEWLEKAYQQRCPRLLWLRVAPWWDPLRSDARYAALLAKLGVGS